MRKKNFVFFSFFSITLLLCFSSYTYATQSRLSGMAELSIVIEDESNMINLWDFAGNPAGLLSDERGSVVRGDFLLSAEEPKRFSAIRYLYPYGLFQVQEANISNNRVSGVIRKKDDFAFGFEAGYCERAIRGQTYEFEIETSDFSLSLSKSLATKTSLGLSLEYSKYQHGYEKNSAADFSAKVGLATELPDLLQLGGALAYGKFNPSANFHDITDLRSLEFSLQSLLLMHNRVKMGIETVLAYRKAGRGWGLYDHYVRTEHNEYYSTFLKLRAIYEFSSSFSAGLYYNDNDHFVSFFHPFYDFFSFPEYDFMIRHLGLGGMYKLKQRAVVGIEYHFRDTAQERGMFDHHRLTKESINLGLEVLPREWIGFRGGYIRKEIRENPVDEKSRKGWRNILTFGVGYKCSSLKFLLDLVYRYTWGTIEIWDYYPPFAPGESQRNILAISVKKLW